MTILFIKDWNSYEAGESIALTAETEAGLVERGLAIKLETVVRGTGAAVATVAAADAAAAAAATSTVIAAVLPAAAPAGGTGAAAGGWDTAANRDAAIVTINDLRAYAVEQKADFDALVADVADIRTKYAAAVTLANENKAKLNALLAELRALKIIGQ